MTTQKPWHGIMTVLSIKHWRNGQIIWEEKNLKNLLHTQGEEFIVNALFAGGQTSTIIPSVYYIGLDDRATIAASDTLANISNEPIGNGYARVPVSSSGDFTIQISTTTNHWTAVSPLLVFSASSGGAGWGPVQNLFLTDSPTLDGNLISSTYLNTVISVTAGDNVTLQLSMSLLDCTPSSS